MKKDQQIAELEHRNARMEERFDILAEISRRQLEFLADDSKNQRYVMKEEKIRVVETGAGFQEVGYVYLKCQLCERVHAQVHFEGKRYADKCMYCDNAIYEHPEPEPYGAGDTWAAPKEYYIE